MSLAYHDTSPGLCLEPVTGDSQSYITDYSELERTHNDHEVQFLNEWPYKDQTHKSSLFRTVL